MGTANTSPEYLCSVCDNQLTEVTNRVECCSREGIRGNHHKDWHHHWKHRARSQWRGRRQLGLRNRAQALNHLEKHAVLGGNAARLFLRLHSLVQSLPKDGKP